MATNRLESGKEGAESKSAAPAAVGAAPPPAGGLKAWIPLIATLVSMPLVAYGVTTFVLLPRLQQGLGMSASKESSPKHGGEKSANSGGSSAERKEMFTLNKLLVNVAQTMGSRYLMTSVTLAGTDPDFKEKVQSHEPQLRDMACGALRLKTIADIEKPGALNLVRSELLSGFNNILGGSVVEEIYITEFAIQ